MTDFNTRYNQYKLDEEKYLAYINKLNELRSSQNANLNYIPEVTKKLNYNPPPKFETRLENAKICKNRSNLMAELADNQYLLSHSPYSSNNVSYDVGNKIIDHRLVHNNAASDLPIYGISYQAPLNSFIGNEYQRQADIFRDIKIVKNPEIYNMVIDNEK